MEFPWNLWDLPWNLYKTIINIRHSDQTTVCHQSSDDAACLVKLFGQGLILIGIQMFLAHVTWQMN